MASRHLPRGNSGPPSSRIGRAIAALAIATSVATPVVLVATPSSADAAGCPSYYCGSGNHNEHAAVDAP